MSEILTKREAIAVQVLAGLVSNGMITRWSPSRSEEFAGAAVECADALLAELARTEPKAETPAPDDLWYPDSGEWKEHDGGECPVSADIVIEMMLRHERVQRHWKSSPDPAGSFRWDHVGNDFDILAYRVVG